MSPELLAQALAKSVEKQAVEALSKPATKETAQLLLKLIRDLAAATVLLSEDSGDRAETRIRIAERR